MATYIIATEGPLKGERFEVKGGERVGREKGEIVLDDPKVSSQHALIKKSLMGQLTLTDQRSKNGIIVEGNRVDRVKLKDGVEFRIGSSSFRVEVVTKETSTNTKPLSQDNDGESEADHSMPPEQILVDKDASSLIPDPEVETSGIFESPDSFNADAPEMPDSSMDPGSIEDGNTFLYDPESEEVDEEPTIARPATGPETPEPENQPILATDPSILTNDEDSDELPDIEKENLSGLSLKDLTTKSKAESDSKLSFRTLDKKTDEEQADLFEDNEKKTWSGVLEKFSRKNLKAATDQPMTIEPMIPRVKLTFFRGTQAETEWELGYGPRTAGGTSTDLPLWEPDAPKGDCFVISPADSGPQFSTKFPNIVKINGQSVEEVTLKSGDVISIADTEIEVELF